MNSVSIIVPAFKRVDQTVKTLTLIRASSGWGTEFTAEIIVADSTPNDSLKEALANTFGAEVLYAKPDKPGIATNKNAGAKLAKYPIIIFCDSDMEVEPETLTLTLKALIDQPTAGAVGGKVVWRGGPHDNQLDRPRQEDRMQMIADTIYIEALYSRYLGTYREVFREVGGYDEEMFNMRGEGSDLSIRYWRAGFPLAYDERIVVHHVYDAPEGAAVRIDHAEWGIAKDFLLLAYKYKMFDRDYPNFSATVRVNFEKLGSKSYFRLLQGIGMNLAQITQAVEENVKTAAVSPRYDFKFLEVFSNTQMFHDCINKSKDLISASKYISSV